MLPGHTRTLTEIDASIREALLTGAGRTVLRDIIALRALGVTDVSQRWTQFLSRTSDEQVRCMQEARAMSLLRPDGAAVGWFFEHRDAEHWWRNLYPEDSLGVSRRVIRAACASGGDSGNLDFQLRVLNWPEPGAQERIRTFIEETANRYPEGATLCMRLERDYHSVQAWSFREDLGPDGWSAPEYRWQPRTSHPQVVVARRTLMVNGTPLTLEVGHECEPDRMVPRDRCVGAWKGASIGPGADLTLPAADAHALPLWSEQCPHGEWRQMPFGTPLPMRIRECTRCGQQSAWIPEHRMPVFERRIDDEEDYLRRAQALDVLRGVEPCATLAGLIQRDGLWVEPRRVLRFDAGASLDEFFED